MPDVAMAVPGRILVAGDWHGNTRWAQHVIREAGTLLTGEQPKTILHLGDFGIWPGLDGAAYLNAVLGACLAHGVQILFIDGNHEDFSQLEGLRIRDGQLVSWLPRGYRWTWHGRIWLALGGGVSLDRIGRTEGRDWWPEEEITGEQEAAVIAGGCADVLVSHDRPSGVVHSFPDRPSWWDQRDVDRSEQHEERPQRIVDAVRPGHLMHGHLHRGYQRLTDFGYGPVQVTGLDMDGKNWNYAILDTRTMEWEAAACG
jgi:hypothetical protein